MAKVFTSAAVHGMSDAAREQGKCGRLGGLKHLPCSASHLDELIATLYL